MRHGSVTLGRLKSAEASEVGKSLAKGLRLSIGDTDRLGGDVSAAARALTGREIALAEPLDVAPTAVRALRLDGTKRNVFTMTRAPDERRHDLAAVSADEDLGHPTEQSVGYEIVGAIAAVAAQREEVTHAVIVPD